MPRKPSTRASAKAESEMLAKLCSKHGYSMMDAPKSRRTTMMFERDGKKSRIVAMRCVLLAVPMDSALGKQLTERYGFGATKGAKP
jgi:hypothetical protein